MVLDFLFRQTLRKFDIYEGFFACFFSLITIFFLIFEINYFKDEGLNVAMFCYMQGAFIGTIFLFLTILKIYFRDDTFEIVQFFSALSVFFLTNFYFFHKLESGLGNIASFSDKLIFLVIIIELFKSLLLIIYFFLYIFGANKKEGMLFRFGEQYQNYLVIIREGTFVEKNPIIFTIILIAGILTFLSYQDPIEAMGTAFFQSILILNAWLILRFLLRTIIKAAKV